MATAQIKRVIATFSAAKEIILSSPRKKSPIIFDPSVLYTDEKPRAAAFCSFNAGFCYFLQKILLHL
jgi:hypothetical protein